MKSEGKNKGFQCDRCKHKEQNIKKILVPQERTIKTGLYIPTPKAHRHLTKPSQRYGIEKTKFLLEKSSSEGLIWTYDHLQFLQSGNRSVGYEPAGITWLPHLADSILTQGEYISVCTTYVK